MRLKIEGVLIIYIVVVLAKACFEKFAPKVRRLVDNLIPVKNSRSPYRKILGVLKHNCFNWRFINLMYI